MPPRTRRRRGRGEGTIYKRADGRWEARIDLGCIDGKRTRKPVYGKTRAEVARKLTKLLQARDEGLPIVGERKRVGAYLDEWLDIVKPNVRAGTWHRYEEFVRLHIKPSLAFSAAGSLVESCRGCSTESPGASGC